MAAEQAGRAEGAATDRTQGATRAGQLAAALAAAQAHGRLVMR